MSATIAAGKSHEYLAAALNRRQIITGMGGRKWTATKVRNALADYESSRVRQPNLTRASIHPPQLGQER
jgi:hypothetical protein